MQRKSIVQKNSGTIQNQPCSRTEIQTDAPTGGQPRYTFGIWQIGMHACGLLLHRWATGQQRWPLVAQRLLTSCEVAANEWSRIVAAGRQSTISQQRMRATFGVSGWEGWTTVSGQRQGRTPTHNTMELLVWKTRTMARLFVCLSRLPGQFEPHRQPSVCLGAPSDDVEAACVWTEKDQQTTRVPCGGHLSAKTSEKRSKNRAPLLICGGGRLDNNLGRPVVRNGHEIIGECFQGLGKLNLTSATWSQDDVLLTQRAAAIGKTRQRRHVTYFR